MLMGYSLQFSLITLKLHFKEENIHFKEKYNSGVVTLEVYKVYMLFCGTNSLENEVNVGEKSSSEVTWKNIFRVS